MVSSQLEIVSQQLVKPSYPTPHNLRHLKFSYLDQFENFNLNYMPIIFLYENHQFPSKIDPSQRSHQLKQSLSEALTKFYPFAGRINRNISIDCNDSGALYVEAHVHAHLSEALQNATPKDLDQYLPVDPLPNSESTDRSKLVLLAVQISFFDCGGMALGVCLSHVAADLHSLITFMNVWAQRCRSTTEIFIQPNFDMGFNHFPPLEMISDPFGEPQKHNPSPSVEKMVTKRFVFDKNILSTMKLLVSSSSTCGNPTRVEIVSAFIWKHFIDISRTKSHDKKRAFVAFHAVNLRPRINPPLPNFAIGNISIIIPALSDKENSTDYFNLVSSIRMAIRNVDNNFIKDEQRKFEYLSFLGKFLPENEYYFFSSWCKFPYYEVDFGWGKPLSVCTTTSSSKTLVILIDTRSGDGVQAWISLAEDEMEMLPNEFIALESNNFRN